MKETPILFSTPMVQAILNGTKTQTRRVATPVKDESFIGGYKFGFGKQWFAIDYPELANTCKYGVPGDLLYVRETFAEFAGIEPKIEYVYKADKTFDTPAKEHLCGNRWKPSLFMPKAAARLWLQITGIRVERLQDITEYKAVGEGVLKVADGWKHYQTDAIPAQTAIESFRTLWNTINGTERWQANPWVWVIEFKVISKTGKP